MTNPEIIDFHIGNRPTGTYSYQEVVRLMNYASAHAAKNVRYKAIDILQEELHMSTNAVEADYSERCIRLIQNIKL
jgi:hypothetical protein